MKYHEEQMVISFGDADPAGVVFYPRLIGLAHGVVENLIRRSAVGWSAWFSSPSFAFPIRRAEADFTSPMAAGESFTVRASVESIGETSVVFAVDFTNARGDVAARVRTVHVLTDKSTGKPTAIPDKTRRAFEIQGD